MCYLLFKIQTQFTCINPLKSASIINFYTILYVPRVLVMTIHSKDLTILVQQLTAPGLHMQYLQLILTTNVHLNKAMLFFTTLHRHQ